MRELTRPRSSLLNVRAAGLRVNWEGHVDAIERRDEIARAPQLCEGIDDTRLAAALCQTKWVPHTRLASLRSDFPYKVFMIHNIAIVESSAARKGELSQ